MPDDEDGDDDADDEVAARHKNASSVAARQAEVGRGYLKREARIDELNGHPSGSNGPMITALRSTTGPGVGLRDGCVRRDAGGRELHL